MFVSVIGESHATEKNYQMAEKLGRLLAQAGCGIICGGLAGVMEAVAKGAKSAGGQTVGILPGFRPQEANPYIDVAIATGINYARNLAVVLSGELVIAVGGKYGTLSEIGYALHFDKPVIALNSWRLFKDGKKEAGIIHVKTPEEAVKKVLAILKKEKK
jgi:uncharacterized protein (TIGR00725 family)